MSIKDARIYVIGDFPTFKINIHPGSHGLPFVLTYICAAMSVTSVSVICDCRCRLGACFCFYQFDHTPDNYYFQCLTILAISNMADKEPQELW